MVASTTGDDPSISILVTYGSAGLGSLGLASKDALIRSAGRFSPESENPESWLLTLCPVGELRFGVSLSSLLLLSLQLRLLFKSLKLPERLLKGLATSPFSPSEMLSRLAFSFAALKLTERSNRVLFRSPIMSL